MFAELLYIYDKEKIKKNKRNGFWCQIIAEYTSETI